MALWKPSLLMSIYNVRLTSVLVKDKANIYNDLQTFTGSAASQDGQETASSSDNERYGDFTSTIRSGFRYLVCFH
jgi:hypothetical protein